MVDRTDVNKKEKDLCREVEHTKVTVQKIDYSLSFVCTYICGQSNYP